MIAKQILAAAVVAVGIGLHLGDASAQSYPSRPIKLIVPFPAGGPPDTIARLVGNDMSSRLGQTVVIDNRPGAGATIGTRTAANAEPDGYTLLFASTTSLSIGPALFKNLDYDAVKSFAPVASVSLGAMVVAINAGVPAKSVQDLVAYAKANPGKLHNGAGVASPPHIAWGLFTLTTGADIVFVPYRGMAQAMTDLVAGHPDDDRRHRIAASAYSRRQGEGACHHRHDPQQRSRRRSDHDRKRLSRLCPVVLDRDTGTGGDAA